VNALSSRRFGATPALLLSCSNAHGSLLACCLLGAEEEHDVVWFQLKKDAGHECSVCGQVFQVSATHLSADVSPEGKADTPKLCFSEPTPLATSLYFP